MEACAAVEKEVDRVSNKFSDANINVGSILEEVLRYINGIREELVNGMFIGFCIDNLVMHTSHFSFDALAGRESYGYHGRWNYYRSYELVPNKLSIQFFHTKGYV